MDVKTKKVAVLIDAENVSLKYLDKIFERAKSEGYVCFKRIYGNVVIRKNGINPLLEYGITHIQCYSYVPDKNTADMVLAVDAMDQLYKNGVDVFCIVSSDSDFAPLVNKIIEEGRTVIGMGESKAVKSFQNSCNEFVLLDEGEENVTPFDQVKADIEALLIDSEAPMRFTMISSKLGKKYHFDPENYDCDTMVELIEKMGFDVTFKNNFGKRTYYAALPKEEEEKVDGTEATAAVISAPEEPEEIKKEEAVTVESAEHTDAVSNGATVEAETEAVTEDAAENEAVTDTEPTETVIATLPTLDELKSMIMGFMKTEASSDGSCMMSRVFSKIHDIVPDFSPKKYDAKTPAILIGKLGFKLEKRYKNGRNSGSYDAYISIPDTQEKAETILSQKELTDNIIDIIKAKGNADGRMAITHIIMELGNRFPGFSIKTYKLGNATRALATLGFDTGNNYAGLGKHAEESVTETQAPATEEVAEIETVTETEKEAETAVEAPEISETTEEIAEAAEENSDEEGFSQNGMPLYVELPDAIDTKEQLRNAIIFILSTESVTSPTRLSAPLKRYYPGFKIKNYGHTKMKPLLEELGLFVF